MTRRPASRTLSVECYAGHRAEQTPRRLDVFGRPVAVERVLDAWLAPDHRYFKLLGEDGAVYVVRHDVAADRWELTLFDGRPERHATQPESSGPGPGRRR